MESFGEDARKEKLLQTIINFSFQQKWITESERLQIESKSKVNEKEMAFCQMMKNARSDVTASKLFWAARCINEINLPPNSVYDEHEIQSTIISKLLEKSLLTKEEIISFGKKLKKDSPGVVKAGSGGSVCGTVNKVNVRNAFQLSRNPLEHPPVIRCLFQYLNIRDVITFRLVSKEWSSVGLRVLTTRANIKMNSAESTCKFFEEFSRTSNEILPFRSFIFCRRNIWSANELEEFFAKQGNYITRLKLEGVFHLVDNYLERINCFDITPWISNCPLKKPTNPRCRTKLSVSCEQSGGLTVDSSALVKITKLELNEMQVNLQDGIRIRPTKLKLSRMRFTKNGDTLTKLCVNDILDFSKAKSIRLDGDGIGIRSTKLSLDMGGYLKLEHLALSTITLLNLKMCTWEIEKLEIDFMTLRENTQMHLKELVVHRHSKLGMSMLPPSVEKLTFIAVKDNTFLFTGPVPKNNVRFLALHFCRNNVSLFTDNAHFPNLTHLYLEKELQCSQDLEFDLQLLPISVKFLGLRGFEVINTGNHSVHLEKLILSTYTYFKIKVLCDFRVKTNELVLNFELQSGSMNLNMKRILDHLKHLKTCHDCNQRFYVGNLHWRIIPFNNSPLRSYVDRKAHCYLFQNQRGTAIEEREFKFKNDLHHSYNEME